MWVGWRCGFWGVVFGCFVVGKYVVVDFFGGKFVRLQKKHYLCGDDAFYTHEENTIFDACLVLRKRFVCPSIS